MRHVGLTDALADLPATVVLLFAIVTQLGDAWFVFGAIALLYWLAGDRLTADPRRSGAVLVAVGLAALAVTLGFKSAFAFPRPPGAGMATPPSWLPASLGPVFVDAATGDGFGFPSGHAIGSTMVYGGAAVLYEGFLDRRRRYALAGFLVALVSFSRLVLGVHYLVDVLVGIAVGLVALWAVLRVARVGSGEPSPTRGFLAALVLVAAAAILAALGGHPEPTREAVFGLGSVLGGLGAWRVFGGGPRLGAVPTLAGVVVAGATLGAVYGVEPSLPVTFVVSAVGVGWVVALPGLVGRLPPGLR